MDVFKLIQIGLCKGKERREQDLFHPEQGFLQFPLPTSLRSIATSWS